MMHSRVSYLKKLCKAEYADDDDKDIEGTSVSLGGATRVPRKRRTGAGANPKVAMVLNSMAHSWLPRPREHRVC